MPSGTPPLITIFGGGGFIGRYVCDALLKTGARLRVAGRDPRKSFFLRPLGQLGQIGFAQADLARPATIERAVAGATAVINLVGIFKGSLDAVHVAGAGAAAKAAREVGAAAFVQISAIGADPASASNYGRTKGLGEQAVRAAFPGATIIRPSVVFGAEDDFTNRFASLARLPVTPVIAPNTRFQPVYVRDLAQAIALAALDPQKFGGRNYDIAGPEIMSMRDLNIRIARLAGQSPEILDVPGFVAGAIAKLGFLPGAPLSSDQWLMLQSDNVAADGASGLETFGVVPTALDAVAGDWLGRFVKGGRFAPRATA